MSSFDPSTLIPRYGTAHEWCYDTNGKPHAREHITQRAHQWIDERIAEMFPPSPEPREDRGVTPTSGGIVLDSNLIRIEYIPSDERLCRRTWQLQDRQRVNEANSYGMQWQGTLFIPYDTANAEIDRLITRSRSGLDPHIFKLYYE